MISEPGSVGGRGLSRRYLVRIRGRDLLLGLGAGSETREVVHADVCVDGEGDGFVVVRPRKRGKSARRVAEDERKEVNKSTPAPS